MDAYSRPARVGILGGMGPAATADFYRKLVEATPAARDQEHIPVVMEADPGIPDRSCAYLQSGPSPLPWLQRGAAALQSRGAAVVVMPCNTAHLWHQALSADLAVPLLHIVDAVIEDLCEQLGEPGKGRARVGLLGTSATVAGRLYPNRAAKDARAHSWEWMTPAAADQQGLEAGIAAVKRGDLAAGREQIGRACRALVGRGLDAVVYACTEVPLALHGVGAGIASSDSTAALARLTVRFAMTASRAQEPAS